MKLNIEVWDVEINTGTAVHYDSSVFVKFRRPADRDVLEDIYSLRSEYGWEIIDQRGQDIALSQYIDRSADFRINCKSLGMVNGDMARGFTTSRSFTEHQSPLMVTPRHKIS